jgi:SAM-dependent methyltransferase
MRLSPAIIALFIGCLTTGLSFILQEILPNYLPTALAGVAFLLFQGIVAAMLARMCRLAIWWQWILLIFPLAIWLALKLDLTPSLFFGGFLLFALMYWSVFLTQVPYYPSSDSACDVVAELIDHEKKLEIIEIGSGLGGFSMRLAKLRPKSRYLGIEIAPLPFLISLIRSKYQRSAVRFKLGNYEKVDLAHFNLVFAYLSPAAMPKLYEQCKAQMKAGSILVSHEFIVPGVEPSATLKSDRHSKITYTYQMV